ncbi:MAG: hypothetical protein Q7V63_05780 [Gammaproteobacteria bacterium]|nr:hypothetical protein [Gammaproteobacteria bacterium]
MRIPTTSSASSQTTEGRTFNSSIASLLPALALLGYLAYKVAKNHGVDENASTSIALGLSLGPLALVVCASVAFCCFNRSTLVSDAPNFSTARALSQPLIGQQQTTAGMASLDLSL